MIRARITKADWQAHGGLTNPNLCRKHNGTSWTYWLILR